jgi:nicotinamidase-related amidase
LTFFREHRLPIVHIQHVARQDAPFFVPGTPGVEIRPVVKPLPDETLIQKHFPNAFRETRLLDHLRSQGTTDLVITGMMTHMCVDASVRQAADLGYKVTLLGDACATRAQTYAGETVPARQVHAAFLAALNGFYAKVITAREL